jgi:putative pyridoxal-dependent aspartate 1-decarboxylase
MKTINQLLSHLNSLDVKLWTEDIPGDTSEVRLRCNAPKGVLTPDLKTELAQRKAEILEFLLQLNLSSTAIEPVSRTENIPLSFAQQRLWFLDRLEPGNPFYNQPSAFRLTGELQIDILEQSLQEIIRRHEILRTTFTTVATQTVQVIKSEVNFQLRVIDISNLSPTEQEVKVKQLAQQEAEKPFDLERDSLLRVTLLKCDRTEHIILFTTHHIVSDGWSTDILIQEIATLYQAFLEGKPSPLPELRIQYADFAVWQREWLQGKVLDNQVNYWKQQLGSNPPILNLPTDYQRPNKLTYQGARESFTLSTDLTQALKVLCQQEGITLFMLLLAVFKLLLHRYSHQDDIVVGTPIANRNRAEIEDLIGFFVNTLVLRTNLEDNPSFKELLQRVKQVTLGAYSNQDLPFEQLVEELKPKRHLNRNPLFDVMFALQNAPETELRLPELTLSSIEEESHTAKFDLSLDMFESPSGLSGVFEYSTDLFEPSTITRIARHFQVLLEAIVTHPETPILQLPLLTTDERQQLLFEWNDNQAEYPIDRSIHFLFEEQANKTPEAIAVIYKNQQLTYRQLNKKANQLAHYLQTLGVKPEILVGICVERSIEMLVGLLGVLKAGGAYIPLNPNHPGERLTEILSDAQVSILLTQQHLAESFKEYQTNLVCIDSDWELITRQNHQNPINGVTANNLAYVIYTSGSTGKPKGVMVEHSSLVNNYFAWSEAYQLSSLKTHLQMANFAFDVFTGDLVRALCSGGKLVLCPHDFLLEAEQLYSLIKQHQVDCGEFVPVVLRNLVQYLEKTNQVLNMNLVICGSDSWYGREYEQFQQFLGKKTRLINSFGVTEATIDSCYFERKTRKLLPEQLVPIGKPYTNTQLYILDSSLQPVPIGIPGELYIGGAGVARGYFHNLKLTKEKFIPHPFQNGSRAKLYKTGDRACYLPDGNIEFLGRTDYQVKIRGFRIELGEIEVILVQHPAIRESVVIAREDIPGDKKLVAYYVAEEQLNSKQLRNFIKSKLPDYMIPAAWVQLDAFPLTPNGKCDRNSLPIPDLTLNTTNYIAPTNPQEEILTNIWQEVLNVEPVGIDDNFFELGGHSLLATQVISKIRQSFSIELPLRCLFEYPTIAELAHQLQSNASAEIPPMQPVSRGGDLPLSFAQQRLWFLAQLEPNSPAYNIPEALRLQGKLDIGVLTQTLEAIIQRHEVLRTNFATFADKPVQIIHPQINLELPIIDISNLSQTEQEQELTKFIEQEALKPFDLEHDSLLRVILIQLNDLEHIILFNTHHIVSDGWSTDILVREVAALYQAFLAGKPSPLPELSIQYADFALWQRNYLQGETLETQKNYWLKQLENAPKILELPTDHPRPATQTFRGAKYSFNLSQELSAALNKLSQQQGSTLFMTLIAAFQTMLWRYTGQEDIVVGTPIANRNRAEIEGLIGFFVNTLVLRTSLTGEPSFAELLKRVREVALGAYAHQDLPFELLVEQLRPERHLSYTPLFQVMFVLQNAPMSALELPGLTLSTIKGESDTSTSKFDLTLYMTETESGLEGCFEYNTDLFEPITITRMVGHLQTMLEAIVANPQQRLSELPFLTKPEQQQLLVEWNNTQVNYPQDRCLHQLFEAQVEKTPNAVAVVFEDEALTYTQLNQKANQLAHYLKSLEVASGVLVGICIEPSLDQVISLLAVLKANGVYVPLDPNYPQERLAFMLSDSNVPILISRQSMTAEGGHPQALAFQARERMTEKIFAQQAHIVCLDRDKDAIARESVANLNCPTPLDDLAYAIYTSGSTGRPKAVLGKVRGIVNRLHWIWEAIPFTADEVCCQKTSIAFVDHVAEIFSPLLKGIPLVIVPDNVRSDIPQLMSLLSDRKITRIVLVPSLLRVILNSAPQQLTQLQYLKYVFCSGEALPLKLAETFHQKLSSARLFNFYGSSEIAADVTCFEVNFWETSQRILQYFQPEVVRGASEDRVLGVYQKPFTKPGVSPEMLATKFQRSELPLYPVTVDDYHDRFTQEVLPYAIDTASPTFIGHMTSALPDFMHDMSKTISQLNQNLVKIETSKSLIFLEREAIAMLHRLVYGLSSEFYAENIQQKNYNLGIVTTGGTTANISALLCARNSGLLSQEKSGELSKESLYKVLSKKGYEDIAILGSRLMHYSLNKAASILGLGTDNIIFIDSNDDANLDLNLLEEKIRECRRSKLYILALVGIAGTTETGEIDPLWEMGEIAQKFGIHFHVDGAWGGATMFSDKHKGKLRGIEQADSITICGHKQLYLPQGISVCLFKDPQMLNFAATTSRYQAQQDTFDVGRFTIEGSRSAISLCLHGALHIIGKKGYEILINNGIEKAQYFSRLIELLEPFELLMPPALNIVNYRYIPDDLREKARQKSLSGDDIQRINQLNTQIQREQFERGMTFVSKTTLMDTAYGKDQEIIVFRAVLSNPNTTATDLQTVLEDQLRIANQIETRSKNRSNGIKDLSVKKIGSNDLDTAIVQKEAIHLRLADDLKADLEEYLRKNTISIGKPIANTQIYILDKYGNLLPPGIAGELYVGGDGLAQGYLNMPELTQEKFILNPFTKNNGKTKKTKEARLYRTGDLARWLPNGHIEFLGRSDRQVKVRGFRIELGEIEAVVSQHPAVREAVVLVREDSANSQQIVAYVVVRQEQTLTAECGHPPASERMTITELQEFLKSKLPNYMIPNALLTLEALPLTPNGKVDRKALPVPDQVRPELSAVYLPPQTEIEKTIADIWQEVLDIEEVGIHDNFFELGGHSLLLVQVHSKLQKTFQQLSLVDVFQYPTINYLAKYLTKLQEKPQFVRENARQNKSRTASMSRRKQARQNYRSAKYQTNKE